MRRFAPFRRATAGLPVLAANLILWGLACSCAQAASLQSDIACGTALSGIRPAAGSTLALRRGCTYTGTLSVRADNVTITSYGTGSSPAITLSTDGAAVAVYGTHDLIENLSLTGHPPRTWSCGGQQTPAGHADGIDIESGAKDNTVSAISATGFYAAVYVMASSSGNVIKDSVFTANNQLDTNSQSGSSGAFGVLLWGDDNTVEYNTISDNQACSLAYGRDGSAVEVYGGSHNLIRSNKASNDSAFTELGSYAGHIGTGNSVDGNTVTDGTGSQGTTFLVTRGSVNGDGPVQNTEASHNTVTLTMPGDGGGVSYAWQQSDGTLLTLTGNYLNLGSNQALYEDGGYVNGGGNTFIGTCNPGSACPR
jgi:Right handed beta helix region